MVARPWNSSRLSCVERLLLKCDRKATNSFPITQGKDPSSRDRRRTRGSSGCGQNSGASSRVETGMSGNFLSCSKGVRTLWKFQRLGVISLEKPQSKWASSRLEGRTSWIFSSLAGALDLRLGPQGPALVASGKASPHASCTGSLGIPLPTGMPGILSRKRRETIPPLELGNGNGAPLDVGGIIVLPLEWRRVCCASS